MNIFRMILLLALPLIFIMTTSCSSRQIPKTPTSSAVLKENSQLVGGWVPVFFKNYDSGELANIILLINNKQVKIIKITYPEAKVQLASDIRQEIIAKTKLIPEYTQLDLKDTASMKYTHDTVVVTLYFSAKETK